MKRTVSTPLHPAEQRLSELHQSARSADNVSRAIEQAEANDDPPDLESVCAADFIPITFRDIGMNSIEELEATFRSLDYAYDIKDLDGIERWLGKLLNVENHQLPALRAEYAGATSF